MKKQYFIPDIDVLIFTEEDITTDSSTSTSKTAVEMATDAINVKNSSASVKMNSIVILE